MIILLQNQKTNHTDDHNPRLHYIQVIFQKLFHKKKIQNMFYAPLRNALCNNLWRKLQKWTERKIYKDTNQWLNMIFKIKKIGTETRLLSVPNSNC